MSSRLEQFIRDNREEFDGDEPSKKVWDNIRQQWEPGNKEEAPVVRFNFLRWSAVAAAILIIAGIGTWYYTHHNNVPVGQVAVNEKPAVDTAATKPAIAAIDTAQTQLAIKNKSPKIDVKKQKDDEPSITDDVSEEMYHYTKLIEIKHKELKKIEKDEPLLYKQFAGDVHKLDSVYHSLQKQLPQNPNREQLLEAMIQNLQLQIGLLNHQLNIIKQINHSKKSAYEKAYQSV